MILSEEGFAARLEKAPDPNAVVKELFDGARLRSEERVFTAIVDLERRNYKEEKHLVCLPLRHWVAQQFAEYFSDVSVLSEKLSENAMANLFRRLQMLVYSQFWECRAIQRLLTQLVSIAEGRQYDPRLLLDNQPNTFKVYESLRIRAGQLDLTLSEFLKASYSNQIRNAFAHSEFCIFGECITLFNYDAGNENHVRSLRLETWDKLFGITGKFIMALFKTRRDYERELKSKAPYIVELPEFACAFAIDRNSQGYWGARQA